MKEHAVHKLFNERMAKVTKPFIARGGGVRRCHYCRVDEEHCICSLKPDLSSSAGFLLLYYDFEVLKPSNSGRLIADLFDDTYAYSWQRTEVDKALLALLQEPQWYPVVVFPESYASPERRVITGKFEVPGGKRPLFILLDGSWREAKKMFRKSPYLDTFPIVSINPDSPSDYQVRKAANEQQLATAEVISYILADYGETHNAQVLKTWFDLFSYRYQCGVKSTNNGDPTAQRRLEDLLK